MKLDQFPEDLQDYLIPSVTMDLQYHCLNCGHISPSNVLHYVCPECSGLLLLENNEEESISRKPGSFWRRLFDYRLMLNVQELSGIFTFHEFFAPIIPVEDIVYLGEGRSPVVAAPGHLRDKIGLEFFIKHEGQNPSASFKDRGMAAALSYLNYLIKSQGLKDMLAICASTGDTSAAAALYSAALDPQLIKSAVLLPKNKVTRAQLSQPLGAGAKVFELPGVFDDCMKVVGYMSEHYQVALLNSKNPWRVLGQETYAYELAQQFDYEVADLAVFVPVGNAGNITAIMSGFLKMKRYGLIDKLPKIVAVQSSHADPLFKYFKQPKGQRKYEAVTVQPSVAQAAMIGDPVSFPRVLKMADEYVKIGGEKLFNVIQVEEQDIMDNMLLANQSGLAICTQGGEGLAGLRSALQSGIVGKNEIAVINSTAHALKFAEFQSAYFEDKLNEEYGVKAKAEFVNKPIDIRPKGVSLPEAGHSQSPEERAAYVSQAAADIAEVLGLKKKTV